MRAAAILGLGSSSKEINRFTQSPDATWLIGLPASSTEADAILIFGGDGTVHRHLAQLVKLQLPVLVVPCGSGNDFARALNLRSIRDSLAAWRKFSSAAGNVRTIDAVLMTPLWPSPQGLKPPQTRGAGGTAAAVPFPDTADNVSGASASKGITSNSVLDTRYYFCCVGGVGLDAEIARRANGLPRWLRGHGGYVLSLMAALFCVSPVPLKIMVPDSAHPDVLVTRSAKANGLSCIRNARTDSRV